MKLLSLIVLFHEPQKTPIILSSNFYLDDLYFFQRGSAEEICTFVSRQITNISKPGELKSVKHQEHICHLRAAASGLTVAAVCDSEYPVKVVFNMLREALEIFVKSVPENSWKGATKDLGLKIPELEELLKKYQNPGVDKVESIKKELDETKDILEDTLLKLMERGDKMDDLLRQTDDLSAGTSLMVKKSIELNSTCGNCTIL